MSLSLHSTFVDPEKVISQLTIAPGSTVADFGCGSGYFSFAFARAVGKEGSVIALDILPSALSAVASRAKIAGFPQIVTKRANLEREHGSGLDNESVDWVVLKDILFQNSRKDVLLKEVYRIVRPQGHVLLMEWRESVGVVGPEFHMRLSREDLLKIIDESGFSIQKELTVGDFHDAFLLVK